MKRTDWSRRPLTPKQIAYALADVTHLRTVYLKLAKLLEDSGREEWLDEEMATLNAPETYESRPEAAWERIRTRSLDRRFLGLVRELAVRPSRAMCRGPSSRKTRPCWRWRPASPVARKI